MKTSSGESFCHTPLWWHETEFWLNSNSKLQLTSDCASKYNIDRSSSSYPGYEWPTVSIHSNSWYLEIGTYVKTSCQDLIIPYGKGVKVAKVCKELHQRQTENPSKSINEHSWVALTFLRQIELQSMRNGLCHGLAWHIVMELKIIFLYSHKLFGDWGSTNISKMNLLNLSLATRLHYESQSLFCHTNTRKWEQKINMMSILSIL